MATLLGQLDRVGVDGWLGWVFDLFAHWPRHLVLVSALVVGLALWRRMPLAALAAFAAGGVNLAVLAMTSAAAPQAPPEGARLMRVVSANVHKSMAAIERVAELAREYDADVVALYEVPEALTYERLKELLPGLNKSSLRPREDWMWPTEDSVLALRTATSISIEYYDGSRGTLVKARSEGVHITTTHPPSPTRPGMLTDRNRQLADTRLGLNTKAPFIVAGDFNTTPWGRAYARVPGTRAGDPRFDGTFPAFAGPLGLPIDHLKFGGGLVLTDYRVGPTIGSDHLPLFATFAIPDN